MLLSKYYYWVPFYITSLSLLFLFPNNVKADIFTGLETEDVKAEQEAVVFNKDQFKFAEHSSELLFEEEEAAEELVVAEEVTGPELIANEEIPELNEAETEVTKEVKGLQASDPADAIELQRLFLDAATITKGYTVKTPQDEFLAGVVPNAVNVPVTVVLKQIPAWHIPVDKTATKVSGIYDVDIRACQGDVTDCNFAETTSLGELDKPITIALKFGSENYWKKVIHYWNRHIQTWIPLETRTDFDNNQVRAELFVPYARLAVFEEAYVQEGPASWYKFKDCHCAASHYYMRGTKLKVTNISGSPRDGNFEIITVNDYGPDPNIHPDRPIDLDAHVYSHLAATLKSGLMQVRVEPVDINQVEIYEWHLDNN